ncbi:hypothetical protein J1614_007823 [Plenodomus biglobosus]|nr:hypothetical protein J1614_007823 [Plenodomus biglobosus]
MTLLLIFPKVDLRAATSHVTITSELWKTGYLAHRVSRYSNSADEWFYPANIESDDASDPSAYMPNEVLYMCYVPVPDRLEQPADFTSSMRSGEIRPPA